MRETDRFKFQRELTFLKCYLGAAFISNQSRVVVVIQVLQYISGNWDFKVVVCLFASTVLETCGF